MKHNTSKKTKAKKINIPLIIKLFFALIFSFAIVGLITYTGFEILQFKVAYQVEDTLFSIAVISILCLLTACLLSSSFANTKVKRISRFGCLTAVFTFYCLILINLLFTSRTNWFTPILGLSTWERFQMNVNLVPLHTIKNYISNINQDELPHILTNLIGNFIAFMPLAFFLPVFIKKLRRLLPFTIIMLIGIVIIELIQGFTSLGKCDIDDLILNLAGAVTAFFVCKIPLVFRFRNWFCYHPIDTDTNA